MGNNENLGGLEATAEIDVSGIVQGAKTMAASVDMLNAIMEKGEGGLRKYEQSGKVAAGSMSDMAAKAKSVRRGGRP